MSTKQYDTNRNQELRFWTKPTYIPAIKYDKQEMLQKVQKLQKNQPKAAIWPSLASQLQLPKKLTYKQQSAIDIAYKQLRKKLSITTA